jgi:hypothetical protein
MRFARWITKDTNTLKICNTYCLSMATVVSWRRLNFTLYTHCVCYIKLYVLYSKLSQKGTELYLCSFFNLVGGGWSAPCPGRFTPWEWPGVWALGTVWTDAKNFFLSESLCQLCNPSEPRGQVTRWSFLLCIINCHNHYLRFTIFLLLFHSAPIFLFYIPFTVAHTEIQISERLNWAIYL